MSGQVRLADLEAALLDPWQRYRERRIRERHEAAEREEALRSAAEDCDEAATLSADTREEGLELFLRRACLR